MFFRDVRFKAFDITAPPPLQKITESSDDVDRWAIDKSSSLIQIKQKISHLKPATKCVPITA